MSSGVIQSSAGRGALSVTCRDGSSLGLSPVASRKLARHLRQKICQAAPIRISVLMATLPERPFPQAPKDTLLSVALRIVSGRRLA